MRTKFTCARDPEFVLHVSAYKWIHGTFTDVPAFIAQTPVIKHELVSKSKLVIMNTYDVF